MTFQSAKVYLPEISAPALLMLHLNTTEKVRPLVYSLISDQQHVSRTRFSPRLGTRKDPICQFIHYYIPPLPPSHFCIIQDHPPYSSKMSSRCCLLASIQTKLALGAEQVAAACTCAKKASGSPVMSCIYFLFSRASPERVIVKKLYDGETVTWGVRG